jgi:predicted aspartyl protease
MTRYAYNQQVTPPAPFVHVTLRSPDGARDAGELPALVDTGADRTIVPRGAVNGLGLIPLDEVPLMGMGGQVGRYSTFIVQLQVRQLAPFLVEVAASDDEPFIILGRDVLNRYRIILDGPKLALEID